MDLLNTIAGRHIGWVIQVNHHRDRHGLPPVTRPLPPMLPVAPVLRCDCGAVFGLASTLMAHCRIAHGREATRQERTPR